MTRRLLGTLYIQVLIGIVLGLAVGALWPQTGAALKPLGDAFIKLVKMVIAPVIFCTVALGIAQMSDMKKFGRIGGKALIYFEAVSTLALVIGLVVGVVVRPGAGFHIDPASLDPSVTAAYATRAHTDSVTEHLMNIIPDTFFSAFAGGDLLQVLLISILFGFACTRMGEAGRQVAGGLEKIVKVFFAIIHMLVRLAPIGAFGAMAFTIGRYGLTSLLPLGALVACFYTTCLLFVAIVLGAIARLVGFSLWRFLSYIREELLITLGSSSSEPALPKLIEKLERLGAPPAVVGLVIPTGYSFNLDGTNIYLTLAILFLAQATDTDLSAMQMLTILLVAMLTSKGASGVTGAGFVTLAATLSVVPAIPLVALATIVGIDRFMSECRAITNIIGNGVAALVVARWEKVLDMGRLREELKRGPARAEQSLA
ncbi:MAG TPA: dicarboxylate/amino acid:cation symporter [Rhizomicrobium sp.]|nr:dicarboxylate/amino acid:cation symporter [Rhizomicrobium sp.]